MSEIVQIFDTTLRDGEQSPGVSLNVKEKVKIARQLAKLGVNVIEAGFPITSPGDFDAVQAVAQEVQGVTIAALARANKKDIDFAWEAIKSATQPRIHTFIATSDIHLKYKLRKERQQVLDIAVEAVKYAAQYTSDVEFSAEDASRSDINYLAQVLEAVIAAGAKVVNIPDTVGYTTPGEFAAIIQGLKERVSNIDQAIISVHCHDDLGLAVANSLAAVKAGARQVEGAINGIGERAGNAALEEVIMSLYTRGDHYQLHTGIKTEEISRTSKLVANLTGMVVQPNKAVVGKNAFAHEAGIHQDGVLKEPTTYEIMNPTMVGISKNNLVLGKHSGRHAFKERLTELGFELSEEELNKAFVRFKALADKKKEIIDDDLVAIVDEEAGEMHDAYKLDYFQIFSGTNVVPSATVGLKTEEGQIEDASCGDGPVDAIYKAIDKLTGLHLVLDAYIINAVTGGKDALGEVSVKLRKKDSNRAYIGRGVSTDVLEASAKAYINATNKVIYAQNKHQ